MFTTKVNKVTTIFLVMVLLATFINPFPASACLEKDAKEAWAEKQEAEEECEKAVEEVAQKKDELHKANKYVGAAVGSYWLAVASGNLFAIALAWTVLAAAVSEQALAQQAYNQAKWELKFKNQTLQILSERWRKIMAKLQALERKIALKKKEISKLKGELESLESQLAGETDCGEIEKLKSKISAKEKKISKAETKLKQLHKDHGC